MPVANPPAWTAARLLEKINFVLITIIVAATIAVVIIINIATATMASSSSTSFSSLVVFSRILVVIT